MGINPHPKNALLSLVTFVTFVIFCVFFMNNQNPDVQFMSLVYGVMFSFF